MWEAVFAKLAGLGVAAKAGAASAAVVAATTGAGAAGALPAPAQDAVADAVRTVTPFELPAAAQGSADFGQAVSRDARDPEAPGVDGPSVANTASKGRSRTGQQNAENAGRPEGAGGLEGGANPAKGRDRTDAAVR